jgi:hypothetical protein
VANFRVSTNSSNETREDKIKLNKGKGIFKFFIFKPAFLKIGLSVDLQTALTAGTRRAEGQWLQQQLNAVKLRVFRVGTGMQTVRCTVGQYVEPIKTSVEDAASERR